jgi:integrase
MDTRNARRRLEAEKRHMEPISPGRYIVYRRPKSGAAGSWQACFVNPETKKQTRGTLGAADDFQEPDGKTVLSFPQAHAAALMWCREQERRANIVAEGDTVPDGPFTVADAMEAYFKDAARRGAKSVTTARGKAKYWILPAFGSMQVSKLTRGRIEKWLDEIANSPKGGRRGLGSKGKQMPPPQTSDQKRARRATANRHLKLLKAALTFCVDNSLTYSLDRPWQLVKTYKGTDRARIRFLTVEEQVRLVNACTGDFRNLVLGALLTGCRYGELTRLLCRDYDRNNGTVLIAESKSGKSRHIYLSQEGRKLFDEITANAALDDLVFINGRLGGRKHGPGAGQWKSGEQRKKIIQACQEAGIEPTTFHELRHTYASTLVNRGCPLMVVAKLLGHADTQITEKHYAHLARSTVREELLRAMPNLGIVG